MLLQALDQDRLSLIALYRLAEGDLGDSVLWLGRAKMKRGASHVELDQEFAIHAVLRNGKVTAVRTFLAWEDALLIAAN